MYFLIRDGGIYARNIHIDERLRNSLAVAAEDPRKIEYIRLSQPDRLKTGKPSTVFKYVAMQTGIEYTPDDVNTLSTVVGELLPTRYGFDIEIVEGQDIIDLYARTMHTCMTSSASLNFYARNAPNIRALRVMRDGQPFGRAILWSLKNGSCFVDRIYPSDGAHINEISELARQNNWLMRYSQSAAIRHESLKDVNNIITVPLLAQSDTERSVHSRGGFPYMDTLVYMKHSPDKAQVMLAVKHRPGWVSIQANANAYRDMAYCPLLRGWEINANMTKALVIAEDGTFRPETRFSLTLLNRTHTLIRYPKNVLKERGGQFTRVYISNDANIPLGSINGVNALQEHIVTTRAGGRVFIDDALEMHDGTYLPSSTNLRHVALLPTGRFVLRDDAVYDTETRTWTLKGDHDQASEEGTGSTAGRESAFG